MWHLSTLKKFKSGKTRYFILQCKHVCQGGMPQRIEDFYTSTVGFFLQRTKKKMSIEFLENLLEYFLLYFFSEIFQCAIRKFSDVGLKSTLPLPQLDPARSLEHVFSCTSSLRI